MRACGISPHKVLLAGTLMVCAELLTTSHAGANGVPFQTGDVLAAVGHGKINHFTPTGLVLDTLDTNTNSLQDAGMAFDAAGSLFATMYDDDTVYRFDSSGMPSGPFGSGYNAHPESIVFDRNG